MVIKLLAESDDGAAFMVYYRWGRVGIKGQDKLQGPYTSRDTAINEFVQKFLLKREIIGSIGRNSFVTLNTIHGWKWTMVERKNKR